MAHYIYTDDVCKGLKHKVNTASPHFSLWNQSLCWGILHIFVAIHVRDFRMVFIIVKEIMTVGVLNIFTEVWHWLTRRSLSSCFYIDFLRVALISHIQERNFPDRAIFDYIIIFFSLCSLYGYGTDMNVYYEHCVCFFNREESASEAGQRGGAGRDWAVPSAKGERV